MIALASTSVARHGIDAEIDAALSRLEARSQRLGDGAQALASAIRRATDGGKRFRPLLVVAAFETLDGPDIALPALYQVAAAFELLHTAFVVHDDVIDHDTERRGVPNVGGEFRLRASDKGADAAGAALLGDAAAILAGDLLLHEAGRLIALAEIPSTLRAELLALFDEAVLVSAAGELADVENAVSPGEADPDTVLRTTHDKTAVYSFSAPLEAGAVMAEADAPTRHALQRFGQRLGLGYQLIDDLIGAFGTAAASAKTRAATCARRRRPTSSRSRARPRAGPRSAKRSPRLTRVRWRFAPHRSPCRPREPAPASKTSCARRSTKRGRSSRHPLFRPRAARCCSNSSTRCRSAFREHRAHGPRTVFANRRRGRSRRHPALLHLVRHRRAPARAPPAPARAQHLRPRAGGRRDRRRPRARRRPLARARAPGARRPRAGGAGCHRDRVQREPRRARLRPHRARVRHRRRPDRAVLHLDAHRHRHRRARRPLARRLRLRLGRGRRTDVPAGVPQRRHVGPRAARGRPRRRRARLGAAFQDVNFLRDLADDADRLGRDYLDGAADDERRVAVLDRIDADLAAAASVIPHLPPDCRAAVTTAHDLFAELSRRLRSSPAGAPRVRVPDGVKATLAARALLGRPPKGSRS